MSDGTNRRELILETAARLFEAHGYAATSTREIAEAVGCTEAALYYHFKEGKYGLLRAVMESRLPEVQAVIDQCRQTASLKEVMLLFGSSFAENTPGARWLMMELPHLDADEQELVLEKFMSLRDGLAVTLQRFVPDAEQASQLAWLLVCIGAGYQQLFSKAAFQGRVDISMQEIMETLVTFIA